MKCGIIDTKPQLLFPYEELNSRISNRELALYGFLLAFTMGKLWGPPQAWNIRCYNKPNPGNRFPVHTSVTIDCVEALLFHCAPASEVNKAERHHTSCYGMTRGEIHVVRMCEVTGLNPDAKRFLVSTYRQIVKHSCDHAFTLKTLN